MRITLTGPTGFIGTKLVAALRARRTCLRYGCERILDDFDARMTRGRSRGNASVGAKDVERN